MTLNNQALDHVCDHDVPLFDHCEECERDGKLFHEQSRDLAEPETLRSFADKVARFYAELERANDAGLVDIAEANLALAMSSLDATGTYLNLAAMHQARALAESRS